MKIYYLIKGRLLDIKELNDMQPPTIPDATVVEAEGVSDGYHTMDELYEHRIRLYLALVKIYDNYITPMRCQVVCWKSKLHDDGSEYPGWFLLGMTYTKPSFVEGQPPETWDISYHIPNKYWGLINVIALPKAPKFTGYTPNDVLERLLRL
jgi:hypothetical protein